eukprot:TCONS_00004783-protein
MLLVSQITILMVLYFGVIYYFQMSKIQQDFNNEQISICFAITLKAIPHSPVPKECLDMKPGSTIFDAMKILQEKPCHNFTYRLFDFKGVFIDSLCGIPNNETLHFHWFYYVNDVIGSVSVSKYYLKPFDDISFVYRVGAHPHQHNSPKEDRAIN